MHDSTAYSILWNKTYSIPVVDSFKHLFPELETFLKSCGDIFTISINNHYRVNDNNVKSLRTFITYNLR